MTSDHCPYYSYMNIEQEEYSQPMKERMQTCPDGHSPPLHKYTHTHTHSLTRMNLKNIMMKEASHKRVYTIQFSLCKVIDKPIYNRKKIKTMSSSGRWEWRLVFKGSMRGLPKVLVIFRILIGIWITKVYTFVRTQWMVYLKSAHFTVCKFYLKKMY